MWDWLTGNRERSDENAAGIISEGGPVQRSASQQPYVPADYAPGQQHLTGQFNMGGLINQGLLEGFGQSHTAPQQALDSPFRAGQMQQMQQLRGIASGQQMGAGELGAQRQVQNALASQQAMARMGHGQNAALASRNAMRNSAGISLAGAGMGQQAALQDQMGAQGLLTNAMGQGRGQDNQVQLANMDAQLRAMGMNDANRISYMNQMIQMQQGASARSDAASAATDARNAAILSAGGQLMGYAALASDERVKTDVEDADGDIDEMLDKLVAKNYRYKDSKHGAGPRAGIMAQDMEASRAGARVVRDIGGVKHLDVNAALSASLASVARLNARLRKLEKPKAA